MIETPSDRAIGHALFRRIECDVSRFAIQNLFANSGDLASMSAAYAASGAFSG